MRHSCFYLKKLLMQCLTKIHVIISSLMVSSQVNVRNMFFFVHFHTNSTSVKMRRMYGMCDMRCIVAEVGEDSIITRYIIIYAVCFL